MASAWFESVAEAQRRARRRLPRSVYGALLAGSERGQTLGDNVAAFAKLGFAPHVAGLCAARSLATTVRRGGGAAQATRSADNPRTDQIRSLSG